MLLLGTLVLGPTLRRLLPDSCLRASRGGRRRWGEQAFRMALGGAGGRRLRRGQVGLGMAQIGLRGRGGGGVRRGGRQVGLGRWGLRRGRLSGRQVGLRRGRGIVRGWRLRRGHVGLRGGHIGPGRYRGRLRGRVQLHRNQTRRPVSLVVEHLVFVLLLLLIAEGRPGWRGHRWRRRLPVSVAAPGHHRRGRQRGRRKVVGLEHALHLLLVHLLQLLELRQVLLAEAHEARRGRGRGSRRARVPGPRRGLRKRHRRRRRDRRRQIVAATAIPAPIRVHIRKRGARPVLAPLLVATDLQEPRRRRRQPELAAPTGPGEIGRAHV